MNMTKDYSNLLASAEKDVASLLKVAKLQISGEMKGSKEVFALLKKNENEKTGAVAYYIYKLLIMGQGVEKDIEKAKEYLELSVDKGYPLAEYDQALLFRYGLSGCELNVLKSEEHFRAAANKGMAEAQYELALLYKNGEEIKEDLKEVFRWLTKASEKNHVKACYILGKMYYDGVRSGFFVLEKNIEKAIELWTKSAKAGNKKASYELGIAHIKFAHELLSLNTDEKSKKLVEELNNIVEL